MANYVDKQRFASELSDALKSILTVTEMEEMNIALMHVLSNYDVVRKEDLNAVSISADCLQIFLDAKAIEGKAEKTIKRYRYILNQFLNSENVTPLETNVYHIRSFFMKEKRRGIADSTIGGYRDILNSFFGWLADEGIIKQNPCANVAAIKCRKEIRLPFSKEEIRLIEESCENERDSAIIAFLLATGCRVSEMCALNVRDLNLEDMECKVLGKGNKERTVYIDEVTRLLIRRYLEKRTDTEEALFINRVNERISTEGIRYMLAGISERSGVNNIHPHRFRRTLATTLINRGMPIQEVADILGHDKIDTTMKYVYISKGFVKNEYKRYTA